jgi:hypothetical protein
MAATQCSLGTWFVSGIDTLHKGDTADDDGNNNNNNNNNSYGGLQDFF